MSAANRRGDLGSRSWFAGAGDAFDNPDLALPGAPGRCRPVRSTAPSSRPSGGGSTWSSRCGSKPPAPGRSRPPLSPTDRRNRRRTRERDRRRRADDPSAPCARNSGLTVGHCCAWGTKIASPETDGAGLDAIVDSASAALRAGDRQQAARLAIEALEHAPRCQPALPTLAEVRLGQRRTRAAKALLEPAIPILAPLIERLGYEIER